MAFKFPVSDPKAISLASIGALAAWKASDFSLDPQHLIFIATAALTGGTVPHNDSSKPNIQADSHIITPYSNNIESE